MARRRRKEWRSVVAQWKASGQPMKAFARDRGMPPSTFRDWVFEAGEETRRPHPKRQAFEQALLSGVSAWRAARIAGVSYHTVRHWVQK